MLDEEVAKFHHGEIGDDWCYSMLDGVWLKVRRTVTEFYKQQDWNWQDY